MKIKQKATEGLIDLIMWQNTGIQLQNILASTCFGLKAFHLRQNPKSARSYQSFETLGNLVQDM